MEIEVMKQDSIAQGPAAKRENFRAAYVLSVIVAVLAATVSVVGLRFPAVYRSNDWGAGVSLGNDLVTLAVAVPVLAVAIIYSARGSVRARMVWLGALYYMFYNYAFYVFGLPVTKLYLPLIAIFTLSAFALALGLGNLDVESISRRFSPRTPAKPIAAYMFFVAVMVARLWISQWLKFVFTGKVPEVNGSQDAFRVIAAVDLSFMVSLLIPAACLLWRRRPWGYVLGVVLMLQGAMYTAVMGAVCVFGWRLTPGSHLFSNWFIGCVVGCTVSLLCLCGLLLNVERPRATN
ncbi:MAG: hypothetical protein LAO07_03535 [Acidobacteriia bacterium]|nr:hypothetical protein [Terriglobia bacterium]